MILKLARRDPAWMMGSVVIGAYLLIWFSLIPSLGGKTHVNPSMSLWQILPVFAGLLVFLRPQQRGTLWEAALPIAARQLFLGRLLSRLAMVWVPMIACGSLNVLLNGLAWRSLAPSVECGVILTLLILLPQAVRVPQLTIPGWLVGAAWMAAAAACILAARFASAGSAIAIFGGASAILFVRIWIALPLAFQTAPLEASTIQTPARGFELPAMPWWPLLRSFQWTGLGFLPMIAMSASMSNSLFGCVFGAFVMESNRPRTRWMDSLPFSHRVRLLINLIPALIIAIGGTAAGQFYPTDQYPVGVGDKTTLADGRKGTPWVSVALEFWKHAPGGSAPVIESPWGETSRPPVSSVLGYAIYNPYWTGPSNSDRFFDWQFENATAMVYGRRLNSPQLRLAKKAGLKPITAGARARVLNLCMATLLLLALLSLRELFRWQRVQRLSRLARGLALAVLLGPLVGAYAVQFLVPALPGGGVVDIQQIIQSLLLPISTLLPDNLLVVTLAGLVPAALMYLLLERVFAKGEMLGPVRVVSPWSSEA